MSDGVPDGGGPHQVRARQEDERARHRGTPLVWETVIVLGLSLGSSAVYAVLRIIERVTRPEPLNTQTSTINSSTTPDRPWLDLAYQLADILLPLFAVLLALYLLSQIRPPEQGPYRALGMDLARPGRDIAWGAALAAGIGIPGLGFYLFARAIGLNTTIAAANLAENWWTIPVYVLAALENGLLEEVVMVGYLFTRWTQVGWRAWQAVAVSAVIRGAYHLYQGWGMFIGNAIMGGVFGYYFAKTRRIWPLVIAHTIIDIISFIGYALLKDVLTWL
jgi:membrane protease YdiL (CAAX protease family)